MSNKQAENRIFDGAIELMFSSFKIFKEGVKTKFYQKWDEWASLLAFSMLCAAFIYYDDLQSFLRKYQWESLAKILDFIFGNLGFGQVVVVTFAIALVGYIFLLGLRPYLKFRAYQKGLDHLNLKSGLDHRPKLLEVSKIDHNRTRLLVKSTGLGEERYKAKLDDLRASVGERVESVRFFDDNNTCVEIFLAKKLLQSKVLYSDVESQLKRSFSFVVGKSQESVVTETLENVPHFMIAGSTGGGKSVAFKSMLLGLLESSKNLEMYLFDFKRVEMNDFAPLPNVHVVNEEREAQFILSNLEKEMGRRYRYLEEKGYKSIDPQRDGMDRIIVGIDECTDLTGKVGKTHPHYLIIEKSKLSLDHLARKARACGIHLILATQKIDRHSIDTRIQENIEGRIALRMNTMENSVRVLQNSMAYHLPSIPGRAIWKAGATYTEVQGPFLGDEELRLRIEKLVRSKKFTQDASLKKIVTKINESNAAQTFFKELEFDS